MRQLRSCASACSRAGAGVPVGVPRHEDSESRQEKLVDGELRVHAWTPQGFLSAGLLQLEEDGDAISATFTYDASYLESRLSYPLDPLNMPLGRGRLATDSQFVTLGAIFDAAPDAWGRRVVSAQLPAEARQRVFRNAFLRGADGIGSLVLTPEIISGDIELDRIVAISLAERPDGHPNSPIYGHVKLPHLS